MARTVHKEKHAVKRKEILDSAQRFVYTKGYDQMSIQDILNDLKISKGAFYHYFDSKQALLEALIEQMRLDAEPIMLPIINDPNLPALNKLHRFFDASARWKTARKDYVLSLVKIWYADENALVRLKIEENLIHWSTPLLVGVIQQGVAEGVFNTPYPDQIGELVLAMLYHIGNAMVGMIFSDGEKAIELAQAEKMVCAYNDAMERLLGAPAGSIRLMETALLKEWFV